MSKKKSEWVLIFIVGALACSFFSIVNFLRRKNFLKKIEKRVSDEEYSAEFLLKYPEILQVQVIEARKELAKYLSIPADVISMEMRLSDLEMVEFAFGFSTEIEDIWDDIYDGLKGTELEFSQVQDLQVEMVHEFLFLAIKARALGY